MRQCLSQVEDRHQVVLFAGEKRAVVLRVQRHSVIALARPDGISPYNLVRRGIDDRKDVLILQIDVDLAGDGIVLRHPGFAVEMQRPDNLVVLHINDSFRLAPFIGNVQLVERRRVGAAVRLGFGLEFLDDLHLFQVNDADGVVVRVRRVELLEFRNVFDTFGAGRVGDDGDDVVRPQVDHIGLVPRPGVRRSSSDRPHQSSR